MRLNPLKVSRYALAASVVIFLIGLAIESIQASNGRQVAPNLILIWLVLAVAVGCTGISTACLAWVLDRIRSEIVAHAYQAGQQDANGDVHPIRRR
jgi:hypothetical protein